MASSSSRTGNRFGRTKILIAAALAALVWCALFGLAIYPSTGGIVGLVGFAVPLVLIAVATVFALSVGALREETDQLRTERDILRRALRDQPPPSFDDPESVAQTPEAQTPADQPESAPAAEKLAVKAPVKRRPPAPARQSSLPLEPEGDRAPDLSLPDLIRALHFPETPEDKAGMRALQLALRDHKAQLVVRAAQDMLTLLSQDGVYMDDLEPERVGPDLWRRFAAGDRAREIAAVGGIHDPAALELCRRKLQDNTVYRDTAHHFLRRFDQTLSDLVPQLNDDGLLALTETRSARAFMLVGRAAGVFG